MKLLIVHHIDMYRFGLSAGLNNSSLQIDSITCVKSGEEAIMQCKRKQFDTIIIEIDLPEMSGIETIRRILAKSPEMRILAVSQPKQELDILPAYTAGAMGHLSLDNNFNTISKVLKQVANGKYYVDAKFVVHAYPNLSNKKNTDSENYLPELSLVELQILQLISEGKNSQEIGKSTYRSKRTVDGYRTGMCKKFGVKTTVELVALAIRKGLVFDKKTD